jgi:AmmeMemoRadiSam system protein A
MNLITLVKKTVTEYVKNKKVIPLPEDDNSKLRSESKPLFITIKKNGSLRGCMGTIESTESNLGKEIISNSIAACRDPRFNPIDEVELKELEYEINIIREKIEIKKDYLEKVNPKKEGIIVKSGLKTGLLLPDIEGVDNSKKQLEIALRKAGITRDDYKILKFKTDKYEGM